MSNSKLYVGNLSFDSSESDIRAAFEPFGAISEVYLPTDKMTGRPRGFAFVTMGSAAEAKAAIDQLNGKDLGGRALTVNEARPKESSGGGGGGGRREGGYGGGGGGRGRY